MVLGERGFKSAAPVLVALSVLALCAACSSSAGKQATTTSSQAHSTSTTTTANPTTTTTRPKSGLNVIGTETTTDGSATFTQTFAISKLLTNDAEGNPPSQAAPALQACLGNVTSVTDDSVYVAGTVTATYHGTLPLTVEALSDPQGVITWPNSQGTDPASGLQELLAIDGQWSCQGNLSINMTNGESQTFDVLVVADVLNQSHPTISEADVPQWGFTAGVDPVNFGTTSLLSGPNAVSCVGAANYDDAINIQRIGMFVAPPYILSAPGDNGTETYNCTALVNP